MNPSPASRKRLTASEVLDQNTALIQIISRNLDQVVQQNRLMIEMVSTLLEAHDDSEGSVSSPEQLNITFD